MGSCRSEMSKSPRGKEVSKPGWKHCNKKFLNTRRWRNARWTSSIGLIKSLLLSTRRRLQSSRRISFRSMSPLANYKHNSTTCRTKIVSMKLDFNKWVMLQVSGF
jgi:hypothetical protein